MDKEQKAAPEEVQTITVTLNVPAKIDGRRWPARSTLDVTAEIAAQLSAAGCLAPNPITQAVRTKPDAASKA